MKKTLIASLIGLTLSPLTNAAEDIELKDVVVTATRSAQLKEAVIADVTVIGQEEIERAGASSLTNLLSRQAGVQISTNGGAGKSSSLFLRGTNSDHIVVLVDGLRINSATLGTTSFENIPLGQIEKIEILRGPASSLYGADAIGGVIQIFTKKSTSEKPLLHGAIGIGSYQTKTAEAGIRGKTGNTQYALNVSSFDTNSFSALRALSTDIKDGDDDGYNNLSVSGHLVHTIVPGHSLGVNFFQSKGHNNYDSGSSDFLTGELNGDFDNYGDQTLQSYALTSKNQIADTWHSTITIGVGKDESKDHRLPSPFFGPIDGISEFRTRQNQASWLNAFTLPYGTLTLGYEGLKQKIKGTEDYANSERTNNAYLALYTLEAGNHAVNASLREDHNSQFGNHATGGVGYAYKINPAWRISANYGSAFKAPTFNDLYYPGFGEPSLDPERSENIDVAIKYNGSHFNVGVTAFENHIRDLIAFSGPATTTCLFFGCPVNVDKAEIQGVTVDAAWDITDSILLSGNFTMQSPRDKETDNLLVRRSNRYGTINLSHNYGNFQWGAEVTGNSARYNDAANEEKLSGYMLVNLTANYLLNPEWKLEARANNLLDKNYAHAISFSGYQYNNPGTNLFVGLRYDMKP